MPVARNKLRVKALLVLGPRNKWELEGLVGEASRAERRSLGELRGKAGDEWKDPRVGRRHLEGRGGGLSICLLRGSWGAESQFGDPLANLPPCWAMPCFAFVVMFK